jgi:hypothetical protein
MDVLAGSPVAGAVYALVNDGSSANFPSATVSLAVGNIAALAVTVWRAGVFAYAAPVVRCLKTTYWAGLVCVFVSFFGNSVQAIWTL